MAPKAKKQKRTDPGDDEAAAPGPQIAPGNAVIFSELFEPAIEYLKCLPQFDDWQCPAFLKAGIKNTDNEVGGYMAPFLKNECLAALERAEQYTSAVPFRLFDRKFSPIPGVALSRAQIITAIHDDTTTLDEFPPSKSCSLKRSKEPHIPATLVSRIVLHCKGFAISFAGTRQVK